MKDFTENALIVLFTLDQAGVPLSAEQLDEAISATTEYTFLDTAISLTSLLEKEFIAKAQQPGGEFYVLDISGRIILTHLSKEIRGSVRKALKTYCEENLSRLSLEAQLDYNVVANEDGTYRIVLRAYDKHSAVSEIALTALDSEEAKIICENWKKCGDEAVAALYSVLLKEVVK